MYDRGYVGGDGRIMLKWVLKHVGCEDVVQVHLAEAAQGLVVGPCECSNEVVVYKKIGTFLNSLLNFGFVKSTVPHN